MSTRICPYESPKTAPDMAALIWRMPSALSEHS